MARSSAADAQNTREAIVARAVDVASIHGLEGVTIGGLASHLGMSKAGVVGHFGSKLDLQMAALKAAGEIFLRDVWEPAESKPPGLPRLLAVCDNWIKHLTSPPFAGGCFHTATSVEFDGRGGPIHDAVQKRLRAWRRALIAEVETAIAAGELDADLDPEQAVFELEAVAMGLNQSMQLLGDKQAPRRARKAIRRILGLS